MHADERKRRSSECADPTANEAITDRLYGFFAGETAILRGLFDENRRWSPVWSPEVSPR
ncbi:MAG: hypothetical protein V9G12_05370 [Microthrixaceae bacterium]